MKRTASSAAILAFAICASVSLLAEDKKANELIQSGLTKETVQGDLQGAIELYEKAVKEAGSNRALAAKAQMRLGAAYQKQGDAQARVIFERVVRDYGDLAVSVAEAKTRLGILDGPLIPKPLAPPPERQITLFSRDGKILATVGGPDTASGPMTMSPDGKRVALVRGGAIHVFDVATNAVTMIAPGPRDTQPAWSADGSRIAFECRVGSATRPVGIYITSADGTGKEEFISSISGLTLVSWSTDGRFLTYQQAGQGTGFDSWVLPTTGDRKPIPVVQTPADDLGPRISPDSRFISYRSNETGRSEVYIRPFNSTNPAVAPTAEKWKISDQGIAVAGVRWRADSKEIYYISASGQMMATEITTTPAFKAGTPKVLFQVPDAYLAATTTAGFSDVTANGQIFALMVPR